MRHVTSLLVNVVLVDYILPEFCHCLIFLFKKIGAGFYSPTPNIIEPLFLSVLFKERILIKGIGYEKELND